MPIARFEMPDGRIARFEVPDGTTPEQAHQMISASLQPAAQPAAQHPQPAPDGTGNFGQNFAAGAGKAIVDLGRGAKQLLDIPANFLERNIGGQGLSRALGMPTAAQSAQQTQQDVDEARHLDAPLMKTGGGIAGNIVGNVAATVLGGRALQGAGALAKSQMLARAGQAVAAPAGYRQAAATGAALAGAQPVATGDSRALNTAVGALGGAGGQAVASGVSRVISPRVAPGVRELMDEGITPTPGQVLGGGFKSAEEKLSSVPVLGSFIRGGQDRATQDLNRAAINRALAPVGDKLPDGVVGRDAIAYTQQKLSNEYSRVLDNIGALKLDGQLTGDLKSIGKLVSSLPQNRGRQFKQVIDEQVLGRANEQGYMTSEGMKAAEAKLGELAASYRASPDADQRLFGQALGEAQRSVKGWVERNAPQGAAQELKNVNSGYANFKRIQKAAGMLGAEEGTFSAAQLQNAVKAGDRSKDKSSFARGGALMQDLSENAKSVLGNRVPNSGTADRSLAAMLLTAPVVGGMTLNPSLALLAAPAAAYTGAGQRTLANLLVRRPDLAKPLANYVEQIGNRVSPAIGGSSTNILANPPQKQTF